MSYSSKLTALRLLASQLKDLEANISDDISVRDYFDLMSLLERVERIVENKTLVLEVTEDQEGLFSSADISVDTKQSHLDRMWTPYCNPLKGREANLDDRKVDGILGLNTIRV